MGSLKRGDKGEAVRGLQRILEKVGVFDGAIGGNYGPKTEQAVIAFQRLHNGPGGRRLAATGEVKEATWWALLNLDKSAAKPPTLREGDSGDDVKTLQRLLKSKGIFTGAVRGNFRDLTKAAVITFQRSHVGPDGKLLDDDGVVGAGTWWALLNVAAAKAGSKVGRPTLRYGDSGPAVKEVQRLLKAQGAFKGAVKGNFRKLTEEAVLYFQGTHLGPNGQFLDVDGIVGPGTWWALRNPSGKGQASGLKWTIPKGIEGRRRKQLEVVLGERRAGVRERPDGANWGGGVEKYGGRRGDPWCCYFWSWGTKQVFGKYPLGHRLGRCMTAWERAKKKGMAHSKGKYIPIPGDAFVMLYRNKKGKLTGRGHIGFVLRVEVAGNRAVTIDTVEGNAGNRVKVGRHLLASKDIVGFINQYAPHEQPTDWEKGLGKIDRAGRGTTR